MSSKIDQISPAYIGEDKITLQLADPAVAVSVFVPFELSIDYSATEPEGVVLPLELVIQGPVPGSEQRRLFTKSAPESLVITVKQRGQHFILFRELYHNRWQGRFIADAEGEDLQTEITDRTL